jgi:dTMP kinase
MLIAFEGLDQSGKQTQAERLQARLVDAHRPVRLLSFPAYDTPIGAELGRALQGDRSYGPDVMQLLYVANRYEEKPRIVRDLERGTIVICDRYLASSVAYGEAQGLDPVWLTDLQRDLPRPDLTILLDLDPAIAAARKTTNRDRYERDLAMLARVRESYLRQAIGPGWVRLDATRDRERVAADVFAAVSRHLRA